MWEGARARERMIRLDLHRKSQRSGYSIRKCSPDSPSQSLEEAGSQDESEPEYGDVIASLRKIRQTRKRAGREKEEAQETRTFHRPQNDGIGETLCVSSMSFKFRDSRFAREIHTQNKDKTNNQGPTHQITNEARSSVREQASKPS